ncbi:hypothetical protein ACFSHT_29110 [Paraburkholderia silviterrae]|uniref:Uncharacterized protein n=1 Tax=Paraburkholderia silviterrae TaxID=2528715 RepID=A0A4R5M697_9BURK|nr:hypothetical protein [Paraburkholderia silviterrae]TDG21117.1 hypothetical protein EYW47_22345 [Paraburkholderia silviterrae]
MDQFRDASFSAGTRQPVAQGKTTFMGILDSIVAALGSAVGETAAQAERSPATEGLARAARPVLQINRFPVSIDTATFQNALSGRNPNGDLKALFAFHQLVDPVPTFTRGYSASTGSTQQIYGSLLNGASVNGDSPFAAGILSDAKSAFESEKFANLDGTHGSWRPVYASPEDWSTAGPERFRSLDIDPDARGTSQTAFTTIGDDEDLELRIGTDDAEADAAAMVTRVRSVSVEYLLVSLRRPWLHPMVFETNEWFLSGEDAGFCSSGKLSGNGGVLPLIPTGLLLGRNVNVEADWSSAGTSLLNRAKSAGASVSLGPFLLSASDSAQSSLQVIGWISNLVPFSPKMTKSTAGSVLVDNDGGFVARFSVEWNEGPERRSRQSGNFLVMSSAEIPIPVNASAIDVKIEIMTCPPPLESWKVFETRKFDKPVMKKYVLSGTTFDPVLKEA